MSKPKLKIIVLFQNLGDKQQYFAMSPTPPLSGILVAGQTPDIVDVSVHHEMVRPIDYDTDADFIALSFMDFCAPHAYDVARRFRERGKIVVAGGKYPSLFPELVQPHFDTIVVGESERIWPEVVRRPRGREAEGALRRPVRPAAGRHPAAAVRPRRVVLHDAGRDRGHARLSLHLQLLPADGATYAVSQTAHRGRRRRPRGDAEAALSQAQDRHALRQQPRGRRRVRQGPPARDSQAQAVGPGDPVQLRLPARRRVHRPSGRRRRDHGLHRARVAQRAESRCRSTRSTTASRSTGSSS